MGPVVVARLGLRHDEHAPAAREPPEAVGLGTGNVDCTGARELGVIDVENLVVEPLKCALGNGDETDWDVEIGQPERSRGQAFEMFQVLFDVLAAANAPKARDQPHGGVRFDHR